MKINNKTFLKIGQKVKYIAEAEGFYSDSKEIVIDETSNIKITLNEKAYKFTIKGSSYILPFDKTQHRYNNGWLEKGAELYVEWGDGKASFIPTEYTDSDLIHTYPFESEWQITIKSSKNVMPTSVRQSYKASDNSSKLISVDSPLLPVINQKYALFHTFENNKNLKYLCKDVFKYNPDAVYADYILYKAEKLSTIDEDLFKYNTKLKSFNYAFCDNSNYTTIPENLFAYNTKAEQFNYTFSNLSNLVTIPENLFKNCIEAKNFNGTFKYTNKAIIPNNLFKYSSNLCSTQDCFYGHSSYNTPLKLNLNIFNNEYIVEKSNSENVFLNLSNTFNSECTEKVPNEYTPITLDKVWENWNITSNYINKPVYYYYNQYFAKDIYLIFMNEYENLKVGDIVLYSTDYSFKEYSIHTIIGYDEIKQQFEINCGDILPFEKIEITPYYTNATIPQKSFENLIGGIGYYEGCITNYEELPEILGYRKFCTTTLILEPEDAEYTLSSTRYTNIEKTISTRIGDKISYSASKEGYNSESGTIITSDTQKTISCTLSKIINPEQELIIDGITSSDYIGIVR